MSKGRKDSQAMRASIFGWWHEELSATDRARLLAEFKAARARDVLLQSLYPDDKALPVAWLVSRRAGVRWGSVA